MKIFLDMKPACFILVPYKKNVGEKPGIQIKNNMLNPGYCVILTL